jgi:D-alanyl-D-alanine carboxypeptidase
MHLSILKRLRNCCTYAGLITVLLFSTFRLHAQGTIDTALSASLQTALNSLRTQYGVKGLSAAAFIPGKGVWQGTSGVSYGSVPIDSSMVFCIGSATKTFVATSVLKMVESGQLSFDDTLGALLQPHPNTAGSITIRQLLNHTSGMGDMTNPAWEQRMFQDPHGRWYFSKAFDSFCTAPVAAPGVSWNYSNANYALLGMVLETKRHDSLHHILRTDLLQPLQLQHLYMDVLEAPTGVMPHNWSTPNMQPSLAADSFATPHEALWTSIEPAGGYFSTAADLASWGYNLYSGKVLSSATMSEMLNFTPITDGFANGYGLGAMRFVRNGRSYWGHEGNFFGYASCMLYYPKDSICIAILANQDCIGQYIATSLINTLLTKIAAGIENPVEQASVRCFPNPAHTAVTIDLGAMNGGKQVSLYDVTGRLAYTAGTETTQLTISTTDLPEGVYAVRVEAGGRVTTGRLVVAHQ